MGNLFERNRDAFKKHHPHVWRLLENLDPSSPPDVQGGGAQGDEEPAKAQVNAYFKAPDRIGFSTPEHCNLSPVSLGLYKDITAYFRDLGFKEWTDYPDIDVGYAFVFGVGLGHHIPDLAARNICRHLVLIEPRPALLLRSLSTIDWARAFDVLAGNQTTVHFLISPDEAETVSAIDGIISHYGATFIEGSYFYVHDPSPEIRAAETLLRERIQNHYASSGYFEDELIMIRNCYASMANREFRLVGGASGAKLETPVFVVGSGPSLDKDLAHIKKWRGRAIVFSCGSALGVLLKNGVRPDLHVENENTPQLVNNLKGFQAAYGLEGITLVASMTIDPNLKGLFGACWLFFRPVLSSTSVMGGGAEPVDFAEPLVANAGFAVSVELGFQNIYFFGVDCGCPPGGAHHAKDAVYYDAGYDNWAEGEGLSFLETQLNRQAPGNFGGKVMTSWIFDLSRQSLAACQRENKVNLVNCSDGAFIEGAKPVRSEALDFPPPRERPPKSGAEVLAQISRRLPLFGPGEYLKQVDFAAHVQACGAFADLFPALIEAAIKEDSGFWQFEQRLEKFWSDNFSELKGVLMVIGGSYASMVRVGAFLGNRVGDEKERLAFFRFFLEKYRDACLFMAQETKKLYLEIQG